MPTVGAGFRQVIVGGTTALPSLTAGFPIATTQPLTPCRQPKNARTGQSNSEIRSKILQRVIEGFPNWQTSLTAKCSGGYFGMSPDDKTCQCCSRVAPRSITGLPVPPCTDSHPRMPRAIHP